MFQPNSTGFKLVCHQFKTFAIDPSSCLLLILTCLTEHPIENKDKHHFEKEDKDRRKDFMAC